MPLGQGQLSYPDEAEARAAVRRELDWVEANVCNKKPGSSSEHLLTPTISNCQQFVATAPPPGQGTSADNVQRKSVCRVAFCLKLNFASIAPHYPNPQTAAFCQLISIDNKIDNAR